MRCRVCCSITTFQGNSKTVVGLHNFGMADLNEIQGLFHLDQSYSSFKAKLIVRRKRTNGKKIHAECSSNLFLRASPTKAFTITCRRKRLQFQRKMDWPSPVTLIVLSALITVFVVASIIIQPNSTHIILQQALEFLPTTQLAPISEICVNHMSTRFFVKFLQDWRNETQFLCSEWSTFVRLRRWWKIGQEKG